MAEVLLLRRRQIQPSCTGPGSLNYDGDKLLSPGEGLRRRRPSSFASASEPDGNFAASLLSGGKNLHVRPADVYDQHPHSSSLRGALPHTPAQSLAGTRTGPQLRQRRGALRKGRSLFRGFALAVARGRGHPVPQHGEGYPECRRRASCPGRGLDHPIPVAHLRDVVQAARFHDEIELDATVPPVPTRTPPGAE